MSSDFLEFPALDSRSLPGRIAERVRGAILDGRLRPGDQIVESRLARQLGVGQNAVREALQDLEFQGFVGKVPNRGTFVTKLGRGEIEQIYRLRIELESLAVEWARRHGRPDAEDRRRLEALLADSERGAESGDHFAYARCDTHFHRALWEMAGNAYLMKALELTAIPQLSYVLIESHGHLQLNLEDLVRRHREWLGQIVSLPPSRAAAYTRRVIAAFRDEVLKGLQGAGSSIQER